MTAVMYVGPEPIVDPSGLNARQRIGDACVICAVRWPRPRIRVGRFPDGAPARACHDCTGEATHTPLRKAG